MKNKKVIYIVLSLVLLAVLVLVGINVFSPNLEEKDEKKSTYEMIIEEGEIVIGIDEAFPPVTFRDEKGEIVGSDIDLAKEAVEKMGVKVKFQPVEWDSIIPALESKKIDIIWSGMGITEEREEQIDFVKYSKGPKGLFFVIADSDIENKEDLTNKVIGVQAGSYQETDLMAGKIIEVDSWEEVRSMSTLPESLLDLSLGRVDAVFAGEQSSRYYINKNLSDVEFRTVDAGYGIGYSGIGIRKEDKQLQEVLQGIVDEMIEEGTATEVSMDWYGIDKYENWEIN